MKCMDSKEIVVLPSLCDFEGRLSVPAAFGLFMDAATEHAEKLGFGMSALMPRGLFWLTVRSKVRFYRRPAMTEKVTVTTWPETPERSRCNRGYAIEQGGNVLVEGRTEWMVMDLNRNRLVPTDTVLPGDLDISERRVLNDPFLRLSEDFSDAEDLGTFTVRSTDIDVGGHMNNAAYIRALAAAFTSGEWRDLNIRELEASYRTPCFEGETLKIQKREADNHIDIKFSRDNKSIFIARITKSLPS